MGRNGTQNQSEVFRRPISEGLVSVGSFLVTPRDGNSTVINFCLEHRFRTTLNVLLNYSSADTFCCLGFLFLASVRYMLAVLF